LLDGRYRHLVLSPIRTTNQNIVCGNEMIRLIPAVIESPFNPDPPSTVIPVIRGWDREHPLNGDPRRLDPAGRANRERPVGWRCRWCSRERRLSSRRTTDHAGAAVPLVEEDNQIGKSHAEGRKREEEREGAEAMADIAPAQLPRGSPPTLG